MKQGRDITGLVAEILRQENSKKDFLATTSVTTMVVEPEANGSIAGWKPQLALDDHGTFDIREVAHHQIGARLNIPKRYYDRMLKESPLLLTKNVNHWLRSNAETRMIRTLDSKVRAFLSDRYRPLDNLDLLKVIMPIIHGENTMKEKLEIQSCEVTERRLYIKATLPSLRQEVKVGDIVEAGIQITNSEVGLGSLTISPFLMQLRCMNGWKSDVSGLKKYHIGGRNGGDEEIQAFLKSDTKAAEDKAFFLKARDVTEGILSPEVFGTLVDRMKGATEKKIEKDPVKSVEVVQKQFNLSDAERGEVLRHLCEGGDLSAYGLGSAVTRTAEDAQDYDRASELEALGFKVLELPKHDWQEIALN